MANKLRTATAVGVLIPALLAALEPPVSAQSPSFYLIAPTAGQVFQVGQICTITWQSSETTGTVYLYLYKGSDSMLSPGSAAVTQGALNWQIPQLMGDGNDYAMLLRFSSGSLAVDVWSPRFTIQGGGPPPLLITPNGGETLDAGSTYTIQWTEPPNIATCQRRNVFVYLFKGNQYCGCVARLPPSNGVADWTLCPTFETGDDYTLVLEIEVCNVRFRDASDRPFSIHSELHPSLALLSPNGGETLTAGQPFTVRWSTVDLGEQTVTVSLGKNGEAATTLGAALASAGELTVDLCPTLEPGSDYILRASVDGCQPTLSDVNDLPFLVVNPSTPPPLQITYPVGGEVFEAGSQILVTWAGPPLDWMSGNAWAELTLCKAGQPSQWLPCVILAPNQLLTDFCWTAEGNDYSLQFVIHDCGGRHEAWTPAPFTIKDGRHPSLTLLSPNGGEALHAGDSISIKWESIEVVGSVRAELLRNGLEYQDLGAAPAALGHLNGVLCMVIADGTDYSVKISSYDGCASIEDRSDRSFTITGGLPEPSLTVTSPAAGEVWATGTRQRIAWMAANLPTKVSAELWRGNSRIDLLPSAEQANSEFVWDVCVWEPGDDYSILLSIYECGRYYTFRSAPFTILGTQEPQSTLTIIGPNGGEIIHGGTRQVITWTSINPRGQVDVLLMRGENDWDDLGSAPMSAGRFEWDVCTVGQERQDYAIRLVQSECPWRAEDSSDAPFTIDQIALWPQVTLISPTYGDVIQAGRTTIITWKAENPFGDITITLQSGSFPYPVMVVGEAPMSDGTFIWQVCPWLQAGSAYSLHLGMKQCGNYWYMADGLQFTVAGSGLSAADLDFDCDVDVHDLNELNACLTGPGVPYNLDNLPINCAGSYDASGYLPADIDHDGDVDQDDFGLLQRSFTARGAS